MRTAPFELPYQLSGIYCEGAISQLQSDGMVDQFPHTLIESLQAGAGIFGPGYQITQEDINGLSDTAWHYLKNKLG